MVFSDYTKQRILSLSLQGFKVTAIVECLVLEDEILVSKHGVRQFLKRYRSSGTIARKPGSGLPPKLSPRIEIEDIMRNDDETTATQLQGFIANCSVYVSLATIVRNQCNLGWIYRGSAYCQLIRNENKVKRLQWAQANLYDETTVQLENHRRFCYRKEGERPKPKPRPKHPIWGGISKKGATPVCIFEGIMAAPLFCEILDRTLLPFIQQTFPPPGLCKIMIRNTLLVQPRLSMHRKESIGGVH